MDRNRPVRRLRPLQVARRARFRPLRRNLNRDINRNNRFRQQQQMRRRQRHLLRPGDNIPGDSPEEKRHLRLIRMQCIDRTRLDIYPNGIIQYLFYCRCCNSIFRSPHKWGGNRKTSHADTIIHQRNFLDYARLNNVEYPPLNQQLQAALQQRILQQDPNVNQGNNGGGEAGAEPNIPDEDQNPALGNEGLDVAIDAGPDVFEMPEGQLVQGHMNNIALPNEIPAPAQDEPLPQPPQ